MTDPRYRLTLKGPRGFSRRLIYRPHVSELRWEDSGIPVDLAPVGMSYAPPRGDWRDAFPVAPWNPAHKSRDIRVLKIQLGLRCNYRCQYCNQAAQPQEIQGDLDDVRAFLARLPTWFDGGPEGDGRGVRIEFWGGEPLVYWKALRVLAGTLRSLYPKAAFNIITNGSLLDAEKNEWLDQLGFAVGISHDGPAMRHRGPDPLDDGETRALIRALYDRLRPSGRIGFNAVLHLHNASLHAVLLHIAERLGVPPGDLPITTEEILLPYDDGGIALSPASEAQHSAYRQTVFAEAVSGSTMPSTTISGKVEEFFRSLAQARPVRTLGQKCGMDDPRKLAVDLQGNALTCQNTSGATRHRLGSVDAFDEIRLATAYHFVNRDECLNCPVVQLCQGACLFLEGELWRRACDNSYSHNLAMLAAALYWLTRLVLVRIEGPMIRRPQLPNAHDVIDLPALEAASAASLPSA